MTSEHSILMEHLSGICSTGKKESQKNNKRHSSVVISTVINIVMIL